MSSLEQFELDLGVPVVEKKSLPTRNEEPNPMCWKYGYGPEGATCKTCVFLARKVVHSEAKYYKCRRQMKPDKVTGQLRGKDYRLKWRACKLYKAREEGE